MIAGTQAVLPAWNGLLQMGIVGGVDPSIGVIRFNDDWNLVMKVETHNSPSALDPYGGAITGIVGVNRDPFGTGRGAELLFNVWGYCLASPFHDAPLPEGLLPPRRIRDGVHKGVIDGGNQSGIPYARGWEIFDERYIGKPLVYCGTMGILPRLVCGEPSELKQANPGDLVGLAQILGHSNLNTTRRYTEQTEEQLVDGVERMEY